jgi:hypothetical protein
MKAGSSKPVRCAIYTRVSTDQGLDQDFNSLDAQYDASQAYIRSQAHAGWTMLRSKYDDGGFLGGNTDRPPLQQLLEDVRAGKIDLTRSLADFAAWLGLVPRQMSTGDRTILGRISKRGNRYLRVLFVQAAWVVLIKPKSWERHGLKTWIEAAKKRLHHNVLAIALANKLARIAWSVLARGRGFEANKLQVA